MREGLAFYSVLDPFVPRPFVVMRVRRETPDTVTLTLCPTDGTPFPFLPGQFNMLYLFGIGEVPISISGSPEESDRLEHTIRSVGHVTRGLASLPRDAVIGVRGPYGRGWPLNEVKGRDIIIIAGGIGLAPLRPVILFILSHRKDYERLIVLYGARTPSDLLYKRDLRRWRGRLDMDVFVTVDRGDGEWRGNIGVVTNLFAQAERLFEPDNTAAFICGPEIMMRFTVRELQKRGVPDDHIYLSLERNMKCAIGFCGHCQFGPNFICKDGPVFPYSTIGSFLEVREI